MLFKWHLEKNQKLINERNISFDEIQEALEAGKLIDIKKQKRNEYSHQMILLVLIDDYIWEVPAIILQENLKIIFLITAFKSRT